MSGFGARLRSSSHEPSCHSVLRADAVAPPAATNVASPVMGRPQLVKPALAWATPVGLPDCGGVGTPSVQARRKALSVPMRRGPWLGNETARGAAWQ
jgi:hypothetical protein